jgi:poly(A) polymerase
MRKIPTFLMDKSVFFNDEGIISIFNAIKNAGGEARFVGGCIRDTLIGKKVKDVDIATNTTPEETISILDNAGIKTFPSGISHGTITAVIDKKSNDGKMIIGTKNIEITTLRKEIENDGRHAKVIFSKNWEEDAQRRDFTINALYANLEGELFDFFGGIEDLENGIVKFIGSPIERIKEDYLRILRYFRFFGYFEECEIDDETIDACAKEAKNLSRLSKERIRDEILKILNLSYPTSVFELMKEEEILDYILPEATNFELLKTLCYIENEGPKLPKVKKDEIRRLAALIGFGKEKSEKVAQRLAFSKKQTKHLVSINSCSLEPNREMDKKARNNFFHVSGSLIARDLILLKWAEEKTMNIKNEPEEIEKWYNFLEEDELWEPLEFPLKGADVLDLGIQKGPLIGKLLSNAENWWQENDFEPEKEDLINYIKALVSKTPSQMKA